MSAGDQRVYTGNELEAMTFAVNYHRWILDLFRPFLGLEVAEVGAGIGDVSRMLLEAGIGNLTAFEPSANLFPRLEEALRHDGRARAVNGFLGEDQPPGGFDSVVYINVLEHIEDDRAELATANRVLKPGGRLLLFAPALAWLYSEFDRRIGHFRRYDRAALTKLVGEAGFSIVSTRYLDFAGVLPWYVNFVLLRNAMSGGAVSFYDRFVVPVARVIEGAVSPPLGKNLILVAEK